VANGTQVKKPSDKNWDETKINSYADGEGNTIPVPKGFTPIPVEEGQGTKDTGFVIKDTSTKADGTASQTNGNEFVWIPVENMSYNYARYDFNKQYGNYSDYSETMPEDEQTSVATYGGYYIGRYETGIEGGTLASTSNSSITDTTEKQNWTGYTGGKLVVKEGQQVWNYITRDRAKTEAERLYNKEENNIKSKLISSYGWDTALKFIETQNSTYPTNSVGGYYGQSSPTKTGYDTTHPGNIYDMGGNVWEWTTEFCSTASSPCTLRGGCYYRSASAYPAAYRDYFSMTLAYGYFGFRVTLYM